MESRSMVETPFEKMGYTEDDMFRLTRDPYGRFNEGNDPVEGDIVQLCRDDGTETPFFTVVLSGRQIKRDYRYALDIRHDMAKVEVDDDVV